MNANDILTRMTPNTLAAFIADLDNAPGDYDPTTLAIMGMALAELFANVGRIEAIDLLAAHDVNATNPLVAAAFDVEADE